jgi:hypothetical protein
VVRSLLVARSLVAAFWLLGCTSMLGIDGDYTLAQSNPTGGAPGSGGRSPEGSSGGSEDGGAHASGGTADGGEHASGGTADGGAEATGGGGGGASGSGGVAGECETGKKLCSVMGVEMCVTPDPSNGCGPTGCNVCPFPPGGYATCEGTSCGFGYFPDAGNAGTGGRPGTCKDNADCPACGSVAGCCAVIPAGVCGCNFVWCVPPPPR